MPRLPRIDAPGVIHHVTIRGIEKRAIFQDKTDYEDFLKRLESLIPETQTRCYAWVLMTNHAHFLFRCGPKGLPNLMQRLLTGYVVRFNRRHRRYGQLFQNRYKSIVCQIVLPLVPAGAWLSLTALARMPSLTPAAVVYAARRGEQIAVDHDFLIES